MKFSVDPKMFEKSSKLPSLFKSIVWEDENALSFKLKKIIYQAISQIIVGKVKFAEVQLEHPVNENHGDYSSNIALIFAGKLKLNPKELAEKISSKLNENLKKEQTMVEKVEVGGGGFLNLWLRQDYLITLIQLLKDKNGLKMTPLQGRKLMVEFTDPNPFKEFHIGHLYSNSVGESLSRLMEYYGAKVARANYQGDVGMHVAKSIWGIVKKMENEKLEIKDLEERSLKKRIEFLGEAYALGNAAYEEKAKEEMEDINYLVFVAAQQYLAKKEGWQPQVNYQQYIHGRKKLARVGELFEKGRRWSLDYFETLYRRLGTRFNYYYFESIVGEYGAKLVKEHLKDGIFEESEGAVVYRGEKYGLHTRVFINALGLPTYEAKELGLASAKYKDFPYDLSLIVTGNEINEYFQVLLSALEKIKPELAKKTRHIGHGMVRLPEGKMSSRTGKVLTGEWLIDQAKLKIFEILEESKTKYTKEEKNIIAEKAAIAAVKYSLLKVSLPSDITFDLAKSVSLEGDSGPYLMYTYARCKSVIRKSKREDSITGDATGVRSSRTCEDLKIEFNPEEISLLRTLYRFPEVVIEAARTFSPNIICSFLFDLAQKYNLFYDKHSILHLGQKYQAISNFRLFLTFATATIVKQGLYLLGIETVERM